MGHYGKYETMRLSEVHIFTTLKRLFSLQKIPKRYFKILFAQKQKIKKMPFFDQNHGLTPLQNIQKCD